MRPPRWIERFLRVVLPEAERDFVLGDLHEEFETRRARDGQRRASLWYVAETARSLWPIVSHPGQWRRKAMTGLQQDVRGAFRIFTSAPGFAAVVVLTLAVGVGAATAVYSVVSGVLLSPLAFHDPDRVVMLWGRTPEYPRIPLTVGDHNDLAAGIEAFTGITAEWGNTALLLGDAEPEQVSVGWVTPEYFEVLGVYPELGRLLGPDDSAAILITHDFWARRYGADPAVIGSTVNLSGDSFELAGVLRSDQDPNLTSFSGKSPEHQVWRLMPRDWMQGDDRTVGWLRSTARLRDGVTLAQAQAEVDGLMREINATVTDRDGGTDLSVDLITVKSDLVGGVSRTLWIVLAAVCGVLLIAATNVAHVMLGRGELRYREIAVRAALGGSRMRLIRQLLIESGVLAAAGAAAGLLLAWWGVRALIAVAPPGLPRLESVTLDAGVLGFALLATAATSLVFGVLPAMRISRAGSASELGERQGTGDRRSQRLSRGLVVAQVALSLALVSSTGLLLKSLEGLRAVDLGFATEGVVTFAFEVPDWGEDNEAAAAKMNDYESRIEAIPGVSRAGFTNRVPLAGGLFTGTYRSEEMAAADAPTIEASVRFVTPGYLEAMGARIVAGRNFRPEDRNGVVLVDETAAARAWPGENPVGRRLELTDVTREPRRAEVIGVVAPMKHAGVAKPAAETVFSPMLARAWEQNFRYMAVRVDGDPAAYLDRLREAVRAVDANTVLANVRTMRDLFSQDVAATSFAGLLLTLFGGVALLLATVGLHGVMAVALRSRRREMGIRMALGARPGAILRDALAAGALLVGLGVVAGTALSLGVARFLGTLLYEVGPGDPPTLATAAALILVVGLLGAYLPARLVLRVDPATTLRQE